MPCKKTQKIFAELSTTFLKKRCICEVNSPVCTGASTHIILTRGAGIFLLAQNFWLPACNRCYSYVEQKDVAAL